MKRICVYCGSNPGSRPEYLDTAIELGALLAGSGTEIVYGGATVGLMGAVASAAMDHVNHSQIIHLRLISWTFSALKDTHYVCMYYSICI